MPAVFLDKDGTLVEDVPYCADPERLKLLPGVGPALRELHKAGWQLAVATNQSGVSRGHFPESALAAVEARLREVLAAEGVPLAAFLYCPHHPDGVVPGYAVVCDCRKPRPGLILAAAARLGVEPRDCWVVGDKPSDAEAGRRAGCRTIVLAEGSALATEATDAVVRDLRAAAALILAAGPPAARVL